VYSHPGAETVNSFSVAKSASQPQSIYVRSFKCAIDKLTGPEKKVIIRADKRPAGTHERVFNAPTTDAVGIIIVGEQHERRDIIPETRSKSLQRIAETHRSYDALQYPLIFWAGQDGYHFEYKITNGRKVTSMRFYAYHLMVRDNSSILLNYRQLFHQFVVDMWAKIESERLLYIRNNHYYCNFWCTFRVQVSAVSCTSRLRHDNQQSSRTVTDSCWCGSHRAVFLTRPTVRSVIACRFTKWTVCICT